MTDAVVDLVWFFWPVTFALITTLMVHRLARRRAWRAAAGAVASMALPVVPLALAIPVRCGDGDASVDLRIPARGLGLLAVVAWLAVLARLGERAGDTRAEADRRALVSAVVLVPLMLVEFGVSGVTLAVGCGDTKEPSSGTWPSRPRCSS